MTTVDSNVSGSFSKAKTSGAILIASGLVPKILITLILAKLHPPQKNSSEIAKQEIFSAYSFKSSKILYLTKSRRLLII
ncbi:signal-regulatory protein alpha [Listeria seeligeri FSL N1-067]|uniref:Signal-regulatory protein alpha n=1 Tax=Listeria seeligeri FSL N1-067 TaxID=702453 RepID=E3ZTI2_LISSE|nr:signal-regulatory protein alpha [Listeria seeligeri FSL N1-067]